MTMTHRGRPVKWIGADTGWKTGHVVTLDGHEVYHLGLLVVQHSCGGQIESVYEGKLSPWLTREEWEATNE
jgi:hypothetical protein